MRTSTIDADLVGYGGGPSGAATGRPASDVFVTVLMVVIAMLFVLVTIAYLGRSQYDDSAWSEPVTAAPSCFATSASPLMPAPPIPMKWSARPANGALREGSGMAPAP